MYHWQCGKLLFMYDGASGHFVHDMKHFLDSHTQIDG